jgi:hypothetical protein
MKLTMLLTCGETLDTSELPFRQGVRYLFLQPAGKAATA